MSINKNELLFNDLLDNEMDRLFKDTAPKVDTEEPVIVKDFELTTISIVSDPEPDTKIGNTVEKTKESYSLAETIERKPTIHKSLVKPDFNETFADDAITAQLLNNTWQRIESEIAMGSSFFKNNDLYSSVGAPQASTIDRVNFTLNTAQKIARRLPHKDFIPVQAMNGPCQAVIRPRGLELTSSLEPPTDITLERIAIEAKTSHYISRTEREVLELCEYDNTIAEAIADQVTKELHHEMMYTFKNMSTCTSATVEDDAVTSKDIMNQIIEIAAEIDQWSAQRDDRWVIMNPALAAVLLQDRNHWSELINTEEAHHNKHNQYIGTIAGMQTYIDNTLDSNEMLVGRKNNNNALNNGISYHPFMPIMLGIAGVDPGRFTETVYFYRRDTYLFDQEEFNRSVKRVKFKQQVEHKEIETSGVYTPYVPSETDNAAESTVTPEFDFIDINVPYGPKEKLTIAALFAEEQAP